jgi:hypothetical protein
LADDTSVIFDNYFEVCASALSCLVSLPNKEGVYYATKDTTTLLVDGSKIVYFYGDKTVLAQIASNQSSVFYDKFNETHSFSLLALGGYTSKFSPVLLAIRSKSLVLNLFF